MKKSNGEKIFEILSELDDDVLSEALFADDKQKLKAVKSKKKILFFRTKLVKVAALFLSVAIVAAGIIYASFNKKNISAFSGNVTSNKESSSPLIEDNSSEGETSDAADSASSKDEKTDNESKLTSSLQNKTSSSGVKTEFYTSQPKNSSDHSEPHDNEDHNDYYIDSIDKLNFYAVKKAIEKGGVLPISGTEGLTAATLAAKTAEPSAKPLSNDIYYYKFDYDTVFVVTKGTYFTAMLEDENGFLAQKLGGTGLIEVVVTENSINDMITFKKGENFYSCLLNGRNLQNFGNMSTETLCFSTHKYIDGLNVVKNYDQQNFQFVVHYDHYIFNSSVTGFECQYFNGDEPDVITVPVPDDTYLMMGDWTIMNINQSFTIDQLEEYVRNDR